MWSLCNYVFKFPLFCLAPVSLVSMLVTWQVMVTIPHVSGALPREAKAGQRDAGWKKMRHSYDKVGTSQIIPRDILIGSFTEARALLKLWKPFLQQSLDKHLVLILVFNQWEALLATRVFSFTAFFALHHLLIALIWKHTAHSLRDPSLLFAFMEKLFHCLNASLQFPTQTAASIKIGLARSCIFLQLYSI